MEQRVFRYVALYAVNLVVLSACGFNLNLPPLPNINVGSLPSSSSNGSGASQADLLSQSKSGKDNNTKSLIKTVAISTPVATALGLDITKNCVQLVELQSDEVIIDFSGASCPADPLQTADSGSLVYVATYRSQGSGSYQLTDPSKPNGSAIGSMSLSGSALTLMSLCSGQNQSACYFSVVGKVFDGLLLN